MHKKIKVARELLNHEEKYDKNFILKLKEITDMAELAYNDVKVKRYKTQTASQNLKEIETRLDQLLLDIENL